MCTSTLIWGTCVHRHLIGHTNVGKNDFFFFTFNITFDRVKILKRKKFLYLD